MGFSRNDDILNAIINDEDISGLSAPQSREETLLLGILKKIQNGGGSGTAKDLIHICASSEYNHSTGIPIIDSPSENTLYLVPASSAATGNLFDEWVYANNNWERIGPVNFSTITDVRTNGVSVANSQGIADIPFATSNQFGVIRIGDGIDNKDGAISPYYARRDSIKQGAIDYDVIVPKNQHESVFYGLAKAAGDTSQYQSNNIIGNYTESAKSAIAEMLGGSVTVVGATPTVNAKAGVRYICGEVSTLDITLPEYGIVNVMFTSGSTPTVLTIVPPSEYAVRWSNGFDPSVLEANTVYEIIVRDGQFASAYAWT